MNDRLWLLVGLSVRALAVAAARAGHSVCAIDACADRDTVAACNGRVVRLRVGRDWRIDAADLSRALAELRLPVAGIVAGGGFDGRPELQERLAGFAPIVGNGIAIHAAVRTPQRWFALLDRVGAPHPQVAFVPPQGRGWLLKSAQGSGGQQVRGWRPGTTLGHGDYFQRRVAGRPASALFLADGERARVIGWQWQIPAASAALPWRYGGVMTATDMPAPVCAEVERIVAALAGRVPLRGLGGLDFLVGDQGFQVLELNPRPTASVALQAPRDIFSLHLRACAGVLPGDLGPPPLAAGEAVLYAPMPLAVPADFPWPEGCCDIPAGAAEFAPEDPVCSLREEAPSSRALHLRLNRRLHRCLVALTQHRRPDPGTPQRQRPAPARFAGVAQIR